MAEKNKLTPVMQQYVDIKAENPDALLMFRLGDFYESFFDDAQLISQVLGLVLTSRGTDADGGDIPMCGIPWHAAENYFGRLVRAGYKVALVEQMETPAQARERGHKFIDRRVIRVLTPGTLTDENLLTPKSSNFLVAVVCTGAECFDIAGCDISTGEFFIGASSNIIDDLVRINPAEVIYPERDAETASIMRVRNMFKTTPVYERLYRRADIGKIVSRVFAGAITVSQKETNCDMAVALLAGYLFNTQRDATVTFRAPYNFMTGNQLRIDAATWKSLEIDSTLNAGGVSLIDVLDNTKTAAGARKLRSYLRNLSCDLDELHRRQRHVSHFVMNPEIMGLVSGMLNFVPDVGRSLTRLLSNRGNPRDLRNVATFLQVLPNAKLMSSRFDDDFVRRFEQMLTHDDLSARLDLALADSLPTFFRDGGIIRPGFDAALDHMRDLSRGAQETIAGLQTQYVRDTGISGLKIKYNGILGYFIEVPAAKSDGMMAPNSGFIHRQTMSNTLRFTTAQLIDLDNEVRAASDKVAGIEAQIISDFIAEITSCADDLLAAADLLADLDAWYSLAQCAYLYSWVQPDITTDTSFNIVGGRHPVIEFALRREDEGFVKNDCNLDTHTVALLTGPNMAGKSTYLRQNAILVVLAHMGSFVPAVRATIGICDQLFSRVGASDNLAAGQSTFMVEMTETANILRRATRQSFIIFDEIGRGTATYDGMAIAQSVLEYINNLSARTLFATHYHELTGLCAECGGNLANVACLTIDVREHDNEIVFMHKIIPGVANRSYGIHVAKMAGMPADVVARAQEVLSALESGAQCPLSAPLTSVSAVPGDAAQTDGKKPRLCSPDSPQLNLFG